MKIEIKLTPREKRRRRGVPKGLRENEEGREAEGIRRMREEETGAVSEIGGRVGDGIGKETGKMSGGGGVVE